MAQNPETIRDIDLIQQCLDGNQDAIAEAEKLHLPYLRNVLAHRGATEDETNELVRTIWSDCLVSDGIHPPLFQKFDGKSALRPWLTAIVTNRWISLKRRARVHAGAVERLRLDHESGIGRENLPDGIRDLGLVKIIEKAIRDAFSESDVEGHVMLRLIHIHGLSRKEVAALWACHESTVCRRIADAEVQIADSIRSAIRRMDPLLELQWEDILLFCESTSFLLR